MEHRANLLWIPPDSDYNIKEAWLDSNFRVSTRDQLIMFRRENILTPAALKEMFSIYKKVMEIEVEGRKFEDICARIPIADIFQTKRRRRRQADDGITIEPLTNSTDEDYDDEYYDIWEGEYDEDYDYEARVVTKQRIDFAKYGKKREKEKEKEEKKETTDSLPSDIYCDLVNTLNQKCILYTFLDAWRYDEDLILSASQQEILDAVNLLERSPWFGYGTNYSSAMGGISRNATGHIVSAETAQLYWSIRVPDGAELVDSQSSGLELQLADRISLAWEDQFVGVALNSSSATTSVIPNASKSFADISSKAIFFDAFLMAGGYLIMFAYTILMLGKLNRLQVRVYLSLAGLTSIGMGIATSVGLASILGFPYTPMHAILPFICLGIGIDDMFVIMQCWENVSRNPQSKDLPTSEKIGLSLRHAGVSITVTSLTDIFAFGVGAVTRMPGLQSFCVCTAIGLAGVFILTVTWFTAWLALDEKRVMARRDGFLPCLELSRHYSLPKCAKEEGTPWLTSLYNKILASSLARAAVVIFTLGLFAVGLWGSVLIQQKFDPKLLLPADSYLRQWLDVHDEMYPRNGHTCDIYTSNFNWTHVSQLEDLTQRFETMERSGSVLRGIDSWWREMKNFALESKNQTWQDFATEENFPQMLTDFLFSRQGTRSKSDFRFNGTLECGRPAPPILAVKFRVLYLQLNGPEEHIPARKAVDEEFGDSAFSFNKIYAAWETDEIIGFELWRNIGLAMACVFVVTLILLANLPICLMVLASVVLTLVDIVGFLHFWDITIDIISCVNIVLAIGLCVDYSVHIGHAYMVASGNRVERAQEAVGSIGLAVFNGGVTTFLALVLLGASSSHVFLSFFKVFVLTVVFGLFHGLILFPSLLAMLGPQNRSRMGMSTTSTNSTSTSTPISLLGSGTGKDNNTFLPDEADTKRGPLDRAWKNSSS